MYVPSIQYLHKYNLFLFFYKLYDQHPYLNCIIFVTYLYYIFNHFLKRYRRLGEKDVNVDRLRPILIKDIHEKSNNVAVIIATIFSLLMYLNTSTKLSGNKETILYATKFILLSLVFGMVLPSLLIHDVDLQKGSNECIVHIYDTIEFSLETISIFYLSKAYTLVI